MSMSASDPANVSRTATRSIVPIHATAIVNRHIPTTTAIYSEAT